MAFERNLDRDRVLEELLSLADGSWPDPIDSMDGHEVAAVVLEEVLSRATLFEPPPAPVVAQLDLGSNGRRLGFLVTLGPEGCNAEAGWIEGPVITIRQDLAELVHAVYGPSLATVDATREVILMNEPGPSTDAPDDPWLHMRGVIVRTAGQLLSACSPGHTDLAALARRFGTDKWGDQWYTSHYERHFAPLRDRRVRLLEIGVGGFEAPDAGGESLRMWKHFFRRGLIYGLDIFDKSPIDELRIRTVQGDQSDAAFLATLAERIGPLDIVVDDGSHLSAHTIASFQALFPRLRPGGLYAIEDVQTSYWPGWNGNRTDVNHPGTTFGFIKTLLDGLHYQDQLREEPYEASAIERGVVGVHVYHNLVFVQKGVNTEPTAPSWVRRYVNDMDLTPRGSMRRCSDSAWPVPGDGFATVPVQLPVSSS